MKSYNEALKSCPFCGSTNVIKTLLPGLTWIVGCNECGCRTSEYFRSNEAVSVWNIRAGDPDDEPQSVRGVIEGMSIPETQDFERMNMPVMLDAPETPEGTPF